MSFLRAYLAVRRDRKSGVAPAPTKPLNLRLNARLKLNEAPFLLLPSDARILFPGETLFVDGLSTARVGGIEVTRAYLRPEGSKERLLLQVAQDGDRSVPMLFQQWDRFSPAETSEWETWLSDGEGLLGKSSFMISGDDQNAIPSWRAPTVYARAVDSEKPEWVRPEIFTEDVEWSGKPRSQAKHELMLFYRTLGESPALPYVRAAAENLDIAISMFADAASRESMTRVAEALRRSVVESTPKPEDTQEEYLLAESEENDEQAEIVLWTGIEISPMHFQTI